MNRFVLCLLLLIPTLFVKAQNVFDPSDEIVRYNQSQPLGSRSNPDPAVPGLQKWVSTPTIGVSVGTSTFDASSFKQYFINFNGARMAFRVKFPYSYSNADSADKKYPINLFLHGGGEVGCPTNGGIYNNEKQLWLGGELFRDRVNNNQFDGFLVYPQYVVTEGCFAGWGSASSQNFLAIFAFIDSMAKYIRADADRLLVDGLSGGGFGAWKMVDNYPTRVAKIMPSAAAPASLPNRNKFVHIPIWFATGGKDVDPSPAQALNALNKMKEIGADIRYTVFPERGHSVWYQHWREPDFVAAMNDVHKANPLVFFQRSEFCTEADVNTKLGISAGFYAYEWQRNGVTIATSVNNVHTVIDQDPVISFTGNEITVRLYGTYRVRFKRLALGGWSDWSMKPAVITTKSTTQTSPITIDGKRSKVLPAPDGSTTVPLTLAPGFINYQWYSVSGDTLVASTQVFNAPVGEYKARYEEQFGCGTSFSEPFTVVDANGSPKPDAVTNLTAVPVSQSSLRLNWTQGTGETGFEVYRGTTTGGPYQFVALVNANLKTYLDTGLIKDKLYFYKVRAVNSTGAAIPSNETTAKTLVDNEPPTAPSALAYVVSTPTAVRLNWKLSTDNEGVERYDIYVNGKKLYSAFESGYIVSRLDSLIPYTFVLRAVDAAGNVSAPSNQVTYLPPGAEAGEKPGIPSEPAATAISYNVIRIDWADTLSNESGFEIVRSLTASGTFVPVGTVAANVITFRDSGLNDATRYYYRVRAINKNGESGFSVRVNATTLEKPETPAQPPKLNGDAAPNGSVSLTWSDDSDNETGYKVYKSDNGTDYTLIATLPANSNAYTDSEVTGFATYFYYVVGTSSAGNGEQSNTLQIRAGNNAPVISNLDNFQVKAASTITKNFTVADDAGDVPVVTIENKPLFVTLISSGDGNYGIKASPTVEDVGTYIMSVIATDAYHKADTQVVSISVSDQKTRSILVNFGGPDKVAGTPWNNWTGARAAGDQLTALKDETNTATTISITTVDAWSGITNLGHISGDNSGVFPDAVLQSGLSDTGLSKQILISGLNTSMQYNIVLVGSQNEGINAEAEYTTNNRNASLNARYNTTRAANLNSLIPDANGQILITITKTGTSPQTYLNGLAIQEYLPSIQMLGPDNIYAEDIDRTTVKITWSDRTNNESPADGYEVMRATDSLFTKNVHTISLPGNSNEYTNAGLVADTRYWFRVRAKSGSSYSDYSKRISVNTPEAMVFVNFNVTIEDAPAPWNNLTTPPLSNFTTDALKDQSGKKTSMTLTLEKEFNGEFTAGVDTKNNSGIVPDPVLRANYWLDNGQLSQFRLSGLNHGKRYRVGFIGSSSPPVWMKGNYTAAYSVHNKTVYLNSWENSTKIVYIGDIAPDPDGKVLLDFSTSAEAGYAFNAGLIIHEYSIAPVQVPDTIPTDTIPDNPPVDTIPDNPPVDTIPDNPPIDTIPDNPPIDTIPDNPPVDTIPDNPPIDTIPDNPPVDTIPDNPPVDTIPNSPPVDTLPDNPPVDSIPEPDVIDNLKAYPNPFHNHVWLKFTNRQASDQLTVEIRDPYGRLVHRQKLGTRPAGEVVIEINGFTANLRTGIYIATLRVNDEKAKSVKLVKMRY